MSYSEAIAKKTYIDIAPHFVQKSFAKVADKMLLESGSNDTKNGPQKSL